MRLLVPLRSVSTLLIAASVAVCSDSPPVAVRQSMMARIGFEPVFSKSALDAAARLPDFGIAYDHARIVLVRPPSDTVRDTTIAFAPGQPEVTLELTVPVRVTDEQFLVGISFISTGGIMFHGQGRIRAHAPDAPASTQEQITVDYVGPGANVTRLAISPKTLTLSAEKSANFSVQAFDAANKLVATVPLSWSTSDATVATITNAGSLRPLGRRGTVAVSVVTPTGVSDNASAVIVLPPAFITLVSGGGQTARVATGLSQPAVIQVSASDNIGVAGVDVTFSSPAGGRVGATTVTTDANGRAATSLTLGTVSGPQSFVATVAGLSVNVPATALPGDPAAIAAVSGNGQSDTVRKTVSQLVVRVVDQFGNPVPNIVVSWTRTAGGGSLGTASSTTDGDGRASTSYTLGPTAGPEAVAATVGGVAVSAVFSLRALPAAPATIVALSGSGQSGRVSSTLPAPLVVRVADDAGNPVSGATVVWTAINASVPATSTTDLEGRSSVIMTLGPQAGGASAKASIANGRSITFLATALAGIIAQATFVTQPVGGLAGSVLAPVRVALLDAGGNSTVAANPVTLALGNNPNGATLSGTLTRGAVNGVATFDDLRIDKAGTGYTLVASSGGVSPIASVPFTVTGIPDAPGTAAQIVVVAGDDQNGFAGAALPIAPSVRVIDQSGRPVAGVAVTFTPGSESGTVAPAGPILTDASGVATLLSWTLGNRAGPHTLVVVTAGAPNVTMHASARANGAARLGMVTQPSATATSGEPLAQQPLIQVQDQFGNPVPASGVTITAAVSGGTLVGTLSVAADPVTGRAVFTNLAIVGAGTVTLTFSAQGTQPVTSAPITVSSGHDLEPR